MEKKEIKKNTPEELDDNILDNVSGGVLIILKEVDEIMNI